VPAAELEHRLRKPVARQSVSIGEELLYQTYCRMT
jgi:hypothetical protein